MKQVRPKIETVWLGTVDEGKQLELQFSLNPTEQHIAALFFADEKSEEIFMEVEAGKQLVQISLADLERAISLAKSEVKPESWYEKNVYPKFEESDT